MFDPIVQVPLESVSLGGDEEEEEVAPPQPEPPEQPKPSLFEPTLEPTSAPTLEPRAADDDSVEVPVETKPTAPPTKTLDLFEDDEPQTIGEREVSSGVSIPGERPLGDLSPPPSEHGG